MIHPEISISGAHLMAASYHFNVDNVITPMERIIPISNEEASIEFGVVLIAADTSRGNINRVSHVHTHVGTSPNRSGPRVSASYSRGYSEVHVSATCNWFTLTKSQTSWPRTLRILGKPALHPKEDLSGQKRE